MSSRDTPRRSARSATTDQEHSFSSSARRNGRTAYSIQQGILPLPSSPSSPVAGTRVAPTTAFVERRVTFSEQGEGSHTFSIQAAEFQPAANLPGPPATPLTNAVLARGEGTPFDDMTTVVRGAPSAMTGREAGSRLLSVPRMQPGAGIMHSTPIRGNVFAVTPEGPDSIATAATPHTWSGAQRMTEHGQLPTPYAANAVPGSSTRAPYSTTSSSRPADTPL
ncbi:hypothetical protein CYMTET_39342 [Cymbomonas tetramitiformis]|uniref:Uncharacterized protein n=1 Tax=Cymbomonas tetramitiformis TaxID=36881 RepID=A0AAE0CAA4_9CHLO|nr:hypothetical protein CYMTET_39342 [Cymbomonas tetramitiformis]